MDRHSFFEFLAPFQIVIRTDEKECLVKITVVEQSQNRPVLGLSGGSRQAVRRMGITGTDKTDQDVIRGAHDVMIPQTSR
jgi:hypothetical protein